MKINLNIHLILIFTLLVTGCKEEPCDNITCLYGGVCIEGNCDCSEQFTGINCADWKTPTHSRVDRITVLEFDPINQVTGEPWDITPEEGGPDLGVRIGDLPSPDGYWYEYRGIDGSIGGIVSFNDADPTQEYSFSILINDIHPYLIPENEYTIYLLDWESVEGWDTLTKFSFIPWTGGPYSQFTTIENSIAKIEISTRHFY